MLTTEEIFAYHVQTQSPYKNMVGFELEMFGLEDESQRLIHYSPNHDTKSASHILTYLIEHRGFQTLAASKTLGLQKMDYRLMLEPGSQFEFASSPSVQSQDIFHEFSDFLATLHEISEKFGVNWLDVAFFPYHIDEQSELIPNPRYQIMDRYFQTTGAYGWAFLRYTTSLHINLDYRSLEDLEKKVNRILLAKPILLMLAANSQMCFGRDSGFHSYRTEIYKGIDPTRTQAPGSSLIWKRGNWTLRDYVTKVLAASTIFSVEGETYNPSSYAESSHRAFLDYLQDATIASYLLHNSTIFTDVRVKNYIEVRFLDNPGVQLVPAIVLLVKDLVYRDDVWNDFLEVIPYSFAEAPDVSELLNATGAASQLFWQTSLQEKLLAFIALWRTNHDSHYQGSIDLLVAKTQRLGMTG